MSTKWKDNIIEMSQLSMNEKDVCDKDFINVKVKEVIEKILNVEEDNIREPFTKTAYIDFDITKSFEENKSIYINDTKIIYNMIEFKFSKVRPELGKQNIPIEERTTSINGFLIIYSNGKNIYYITDRNSDAQRIVRRLLGYKKDKAIEQINLDINNQFIIWIINKIYTKDNIFKLGQEQIKLEAIKGFKGDIKDMGTTVKADGPSVMNIISTLSFLLETDNLDSINLDISCTDHNKIALQIQTNQYLEIKENEYYGNIRSESVDYNDMLSRLYIYVYNDLLLKILQIYQDDIEDNLWDELAYNDFMEKVAKDLTNKIKEKTKKFDVTRKEE